MSKFKNDSSMPRYYLLAWLIAAIGFTVVAKAAYIMTVKRDYWTQVANRLKNDSVSVQPNRGNILSCDGQLLASSLPEYKLFIDFRAMHESKTDTLWPEKEDSICRGLNTIFPSMSVEEFRQHLRKGMDFVDKKGNKYSRHWPIWPKRVNYSTYAEVSELPILRLAGHKGGFHVETFNARRRPYGSLASRTIGDMYGAIDSPRCGLELYCDSILRGERGLINRRKVLSKYLGIMVKEPEDGADVMTTIDVDIQDLAERAVIDELKEINGELGVVIVMETHTGDIKALVNMTRVSDGVYREVKNNAVSDLVEPGSVFKTASMMVALDDGKFDTLRTVDTGGGIWPMYGREMRDHNWRRGGYGVLTVPQVLHVSSNIGVSRLIDEAYRSDPQKFVDGIKRVGLGLEFDLPFVGAAKKPHIYGPEDRKKIRGGYWSHTTLPWMSIGYETQIPPIFTVAFYNAIANNGRFMQPRFVTAEVKEGKVVKEYPPVCLKEHICKDATLRKMQAILEGVVSRGLGKKAGSKSFRVAGKTGTAQVADQHGSYKSGAMRYWLSFCGYFPYEDPRYTCIVCLKKTGTPASGGGMCGAVFHNIAEGIMAQSLKVHINDARDSLSVIVPDVKNGNLLAADYVLSRLGVKTNGGWNGSYAAGNPIWGNASHDKQSVTFGDKGTPAKGYVPNVEGMGARDAVYLLESRGVKVIINGRGKVRRQSIAPNTKITKGMQIVIDMA